MYLVVDHHMNGPMGGVGGQVRQVESLINDPLACKRSIAMEQDGHHLEIVDGKMLKTQTRIIFQCIFQKIKLCGMYPLALSVSNVELLGFGLSLHHRVHCFQVGGVSHE